jgi:DNA-binding response OmpR family regulator
MATLSGAARTPVEPDLTTSQPRKSRQKALIVDDDEGVLAFAAEALHSFSPGFDVATARSLEQARQWLHTFHPDLAILDLDLPDGRGDQLASLLREDPRTRGCRILLVSEDITDELRRAHERTGTQAVLGKPVRLQPLLATVRSLCDH